MKNINVERIVNRHFLKEGNTPGTIKGYQKGWLLFEEWMTMQNHTLTYQNARYADILAFQGWLHQEKGKGAQRTNSLIAKVRSVYKALLADNRVRTNPAENILFRGAKRRVKSLIIKKQDLENIYSQFPENDHINIRQKAILSLVIFQGMDMESLQNLELKDVDLIGGRIHVPSSKRREPRILKMDYIQHHIISTYINQVHPLFLLNNKKNGSKLILCGSGSTNLGNLSAKLTKALKKMDPRIINLAHIRYCVISNWCKEYPDNLMKVKYFAGHRYISSTEEYLNNDIMDLGNQVNKYFPLSF
jgi:site-specific recombinase XerD